ncbi:class I SAM-dependent methyltransferase [Serratia marcescens]|uniref:class I SAM-dependent methyltransferase n=1 Tax=Serratia marcescens TaxID=615 RepID=UPI0027E53B07|nr:class I SAM-dependent methyltransferase [Serratia marcescens]MDI3227761.1 class I SAM-dependent methyltransferase [Serratia marcescens]
MKERPVMPANELSLDGKSILDMCCGSRMFWFDKKDERAVFSDKRSESHTLCDGRKLVISPDLIADFTALPFADGSFSVVVFDPPHLERVGPNGWQGKKYGKLDRETWRDELRAGFAEAFRVLRPHGVLIFKWNETQIPVSQIIALTDEKPAIWQRTGKNDKTHWIIFVKGAEAQEKAL